MDKGSWIMSAIFVLIVSIAFYFTVNAKLQTVYAIPQFNFAAYEQFEETSETVETAKRRQAMIAEYEKTLEDRQKIPIVGDYFFKFFSFEPGKFLQPLLAISIFYIPFVILLMSIFGNIGKFGVAIQRDYGTLATCAMMAWTAAHLPFALVGILLYSATIPPLILFEMWLASGLLFGVLMIFALRVVLGANYGTAILVVCVAWLGFSVGMYVFRFVSPWIFSPFLLVYAYLYFGGGVTGEVRGIGNAFRHRQNFKRFLQNATINPRDADAHVQLGLIYLQRRQPEKALEHLNKAFEIDKDEPDANYELGKIARKNGNLQDAINHFSVVVEQNDKYSLSEIWREIGATYLEANMLVEAHEALEKFVTRRAFDAEGLYYFGKVLKARGETEKAREMFLEAIESAKTSPNYRYRELKQWSKLAQKEI